MNAKYWHEKIMRNVLRDRRNVRLLKIKKWYVMRFWEHTLKNDIVVARRIKKVISSLLKDR